MAYQDIDKKIRECKKCGKVKPFNEFIKEQKCLCGIKWTCNECRNKRRRDLRLTGKERYNLLNDSKQIRECKKCNQIKPFIDFSRNINCKYGITFTCKKCLNEITAKKHKDNPLKRRNYSNNYRVKNLEKVKTWKTRSEEKNRVSMNKRRRFQYHNNPQRKIATSIRVSLRDALKVQNAEKRNKTLDLIGCSINDFCKHIEAQFDENMSWGNHGTYWHLDHIFPISKADLTIDSEVKRVMHYTNFQPLEAIENIRKSNRLDWMPNE